MTRTTMRELHERRLASMTAQQREDFDHSYRQATLAARVGEIVRDAREAAGLSQRELALRMSTSQPVVARIEAGHVAATLTSLQKIADALNGDINISFTFKAAS
jgi:ribosome-binding protein aMBF1 (putative translation factor)